MRRGVGAFGFGEGTGRFQDRWAGDGGCRPADIFHLFELCSETSLEVGAFVLLEKVRQEVETCHGWGFASVTPLLWPKNAIVRLQAIIATEAPASRTEGTTA